MRVAHTVATVRNSSTSDVRWAAVAGEKLVSNTGSRLSLQSTGVLSPTPRGSNDTRSNRSRSIAGRLSARPDSAEIPDTPGPPGFTTNAPIRRERSAAARRATASSTVAPEGSS